MAAFRKIIKLKPRITKKIRFREQKQRTDFKKTEVFKVIYGFDSNSALKEPFVFGSFF